jgi:hypothetical protein
VNWNFDMLMNKNLVGDMYMCYDGIVFVIACQPHEYNNDYVYITWLFIRKIHSKRITNKRININRFGQCLKNRRAFSDEKIVW